MTEGEERAGRDRSHAEQDGLARIEIAVADESGQQGRRDRTALRVGGDKDGVGRAQGVEPVATVRQQLVQQLDALLDLTFALERDYGQVGVGQDAAVRLEIGADGRGERRGEACARARRFAEEPA